MKTKEPPYTEPYVRWCGRTVNKIIIYLLPDAIIQKNINFLRRPSKKADFIIENIFEEGNIIDDKKIIELYFERNEQAIKETDIKYGKLCHKIVRVQPVKGTCL